jgi:hypothetical protein
VQSLEIDGVHLGARVVGDALSPLWSWRAMRATGRERIFVAMLAVLLLLGLKDLYDSGGAWSSMRPALAIGVVGVLAGALINGWQAVRPPLPELSKGPFLVLVGYESLLVAGVGAAARLLDL